VGKRGTSRETAGAGESEGLRFLKRMAEVICHECEVTHTLVEDPDACIITVTGDGDSVEFYFARADIDDIEGGSFRIAAMRFLEHCLKTFRSRSVH
jgi:hypothetical protein